MSPQINSLPPQILNQGQETSCVVKGTSKSRGRAAMFAAAVASLGITIATAGWGAPLAMSLGFAEGTMGATVISGATSGLLSCAGSHAVSTTIMNKGDVEATAKSMGTTGFARKAFASMVTAGSTPNLGADITTLTGCAQHLGINVLCGTGSGILSAAIQKQNIGQGAIEGLKYGVFSTGAKFAAVNIGNAYKPQITEYGVTPPKLDYLEHKLWHGVVGGAWGAATGHGSAKDRLTRTAVGAGSAMAAETFAEFLPWSPFINGNVSKVLGAVPGLFTDHGDIAFLTANNAIENNFLLGPYPYANQETIVAKNLEGGFEQLTSDIEVLGEIRDANIQQVQYQLDSVAKELQRTDLTWFEKTNLINRQTRLYESLHHMQSMPTTPLELGIIATSTASSLSPMAKNVVSSVKGLSSVAARLRNAGNITSSFETFLASSHGGVPLKANNLAQTILKTDLKMVKIFDVVESKSTLEMVKLSRVKTIRDSG